MRLKKFNEFNENLNISDVRNIETKCKWCGRKFRPTMKGQFCCCPEHDSKYNDYLTKSDSENPWDRYTKDGYKDTYYQ